MQDQISEQYREHHQLPRTIRFRGKVSRLFSMLKISILISFSPNLTDQQDASGVRERQRVDPSAPVSHPGRLVSLFICFSLQKLPNFLRSIREFSMLAPPMQDSDSLLIHAPVHHLSDRNKVLLGYLHHPSTHLLDGQ